MSNYLNLVWLITARVLKKNPKIPLNEKQSVLCKHGQMKLTII